MNPREFDVVIVGGGYAGIVAANKLAVVWRLLSYLKPYKKQLTWGLSGAIVLMAMSLLPAYLTGYLIDEIIRPFQSGILTYSNARDLSIRIIIILALAYGVRSLAMHLRLRHMAILGELVAGDLRYEVFEHLQTLSLGFFSRRQTGNLISRVSSDSDRLWDFIAFGLVEFSLSIVMLIGLGTMLLTLDWRLGLIMTLPIPLFIWSFIVHGNTMQRLFIRAWRQWSNITAVLSDNIPGMHVVKAFNQEKLSSNIVETLSVPEVRNTNKMAVAIEFGVNENSDAKEYADKIYNGLRSYYSHIKKGE